MTKQGTTSSIDQPPPAPNGSAPIWELVIADMRERDQVGRARYGTPLQAHNGRDALADAYAEALDLAVYLKQAMVERDAAASPSQEGAMSETDLPFKTHDEAMSLISRANSVATLRYEEAIAVYLRARGILRDGQDFLGAPIPSDWQPVLGRTPHEADPQLSKAVLAIRKVLNAIQADGRKAYLLGYGTASFEALTEAYAEASGLDVEQYREEFWACCRPERIVVEATT